MLKRVHFQGLMNWWSQFVLRNP